MLRAEALTLSWPGRLLIENLSAGFAPGEIWGVLGRNGSGKSTFVHALAALRQPQQGVVRLDDAPVGTIPRRAFARKVGVLLQEESRDFWGSTRDYVLLGRHPHAHSPFGWSRDDESIAEDEMRGLHIEALAARDYSSLSGGERQRARAAALLAQRPDFYLLDEPLQHMDLPHQVALLERLAAEARDRRAGVVMVLHDLLFAARYCNRFLLFFGDGRYLAGRAADVLGAQSLGELYGFPLVPVEAGGELVFLPQRQSGRGRHV